MKAMAKKRLNQQLKRFWTGISMSVEKFQY
jgi:hypothetical protein